MKISSQENHHWRCLTFDHFKTFQSGKPFLLHIVRDDHDETAATKSALCSTKIVAIVKTKSEQETAQIVIPLKRKTSSVAHSELILPDGTFEISIVKQTRAGSSTYHHIKQSPFTITVLPRLQVPVLEKREFIYPTLSLPARPMTSEPVLITKKAHSFSSLPAPAPAASTTRQPEEQLDAEGAEAPTRSQSVTEAPTKSASFSIPTSAPSSFRSLLPACPAQLLLAAASKWSSEPTVPLSTITTTKPSQEELPADASSSSINSIIRVVSPRQTESAQKKERSVLECPYFWTSITIMFLLSFVILFKLFFACNSTSTFLLK